MKPELRPGAAGLKGSDAHPPDRRRQGLRRRTTSAATAGTVRSTGPHALLIVTRMGRDAKGGSVERSGIERGRASGAERPSNLQGDICDSQVRNVTASNSTVARERADVRSRNRAAVQRTKSSLPNRSSVQAVRFQAVPGAPSSAEKLGGVDIIPSAQSTHPCPLQCRRRDLLFGSSEGFSDR